MKRPDTIVRAVAVAAAVVVGVIGTVATAEPTPLAQTGAPPVLEEGSSVHDDSTTPKEASAECGSGRRVFAVGAEIVGQNGGGGHGGLVLTAMMPDPTLTSVTVTAAERTGHTGDWSVKAYALCDLASPPQYVPATAISSSTATATCPDGRLVGLGFHLDGAVDENYVDQVVMGPELTEVRVRAGGPGTPTSLTAVGICKVFASEDERGVRVQSPSQVDAGWPTSATIGVATSDHWLYGVGGVATSTNAFLTALVPGIDPDRATARAERASELPPTSALPGAAREPSTADLADGSGEGSADEGSVTVYGILIGTFH